MNVTDNSGFSIEQNNNQNNLILLDRIKDFHSMNMSQLENSNMKLENTYTSLIIQRTMIIFFLCVISTPFFITTFYFSPDETLPFTFGMLLKSLIR